MTTEELNALADLFNVVYTKRGYVLIDDIQAKLDQFGASLIESNQLMSLLAERGCKVTEAGDVDDDLSIYDGSYDLIPSAMIEDLTSFYKKDANPGIYGLRFPLENYCEGLLFYAYLRLIMGLSKVACSQIILTLQETYDMFLPDGEDKPIFDIRSAAYIQTIMDEIHNRKKYKKIRASHKSALGTYQMYLTKNKHKVISDCRSKLSSRV